MDFKDQYKHPLWQKKRLEALESYEYSCGNCGDDQSHLHVHHVRYKKGVKIWEYEVTELTVLCETCHTDAHRSKDAINDFCLMYGAGAERVVAEIISGYSSYNDGLPKHVSSHLEAVGYGAGYLSNLDAEIILKLTHVSPDVLKRFVEECK